MFCCWKKKKETSGQDLYVDNEPMDVKFSELRDLFDLFDHNKDGRISKEEIMTNLRALKLPITYDDVNFMMATYDSDGDDCLNFLEFTKLIKHYMETKDFPLDEMFQFFDVDGDQLITLEEFVKAMRCLGINMTAEKARDILPPYYSPGSEAITYENFVELMKSLMV